MQRKVAANVSSETVLREHLEARPYSGAKPSLKGTQVVLQVLSDHSGIKVGINNRKIGGKFPQLGD